MASVETEGADVATDKDRSGEYQRMSDRTAGGEYELVEPIDTYLLGMLPEEGTLFAGLYPLGETTGNLAKKLEVKVGTKPESSIISTRLRVLTLQGLVVKKKSVTGTGGSTVWQRTKAASQYLASREGAK